MCVGIPMRLISVEDKQGRVESGGLEMDVSLALIEEPQVGNYVLIHAGFAIEQIDPEAAEETLDLIRRMIDLGSKEERNE